MVLDNPPTGIQFLLPEYKLLNRKERINAKKTKQLTIKFVQFLCDSSKLGGKISLFFIKRTLSFPLSIKINSLLEENQAVTLNSKLSYQEIVKYYVR